VEELHARVERVLPGKPREAHLQHLPLDPSRSLPENKEAAYRAACLTCHKQSSCKLKLDDSRRLAVKDDCIECHMEKRPVAGIVHSNDTKHRIVRYPGQPLPKLRLNNLT